MNVIKADGTKERFSRNKIISTCLRADADRRTAEAVANRIEKKISDNTATHDIYQLIIKELENLEDRSSLLFKLREAVALLDSESFELYIKKVLEENGFRCEWNKKIKGYFVEHQVDIIAREQGAKNPRGSWAYLVECKRHFNPHRFTGLSQCLQVQARLEDLMDGFKAKRNDVRFDAAWIVTNGKFSEHAKAYAKGKSIRLTGWRYQEGWELEKLTQEKRIFPVTILGSGKEVRDLLGKNVITINDFLRSKYARRRHMTELAGRARKLLQ